MKMCPSQVTTSGGGPRAGIRTTHYFVSAGRDTTQRIFLRHTKAAGYKAKELPPGTEASDLNLKPL